MKRFSLFLMVLFLFILTGCGDNSETNESEASNDEEPEYGGVLNIGLSSNASTLDPILYTGVYESQIMRQIGDTLVEYDKNLEEIIPSLATEWEVSEDMKEYTFTLRDDVYFQPGEYQDGRQMTAEDVKYSLERSAEESVQNRLSGVSSVDVVDESTVKINLEEPNSALINMLTDPGNMIIPKEEVEGHGDSFGSNIIGTGAFQIDEWQTGQQVELVKHENYWGEEPYLDGVVFKFIQDESMMGNAIRTGDIDIATNITGQNREIIEQSDGIELLTTPGLSITYLDMNFVNGPTADPKVREAIIKATNVKEIVEGVHQWGGGEESFMPLPRSSWGYDESLESLRPEYDPEAAKEILAETEYADGFEIDLYVLDTRANYATIFQDQMKENLNIDVNVNVTEWGALTDTISQGNAPMNIGGWSWYPDPYFFLDQRFHSDQIGSNANGKGYNNPEVNELLDRAVTETSDQEERAELYSQAMELIMQDYPTVELDNLEIATGVSSKVKGFNLSADGTIYVVSPNGTNISKTK